MKNFILTGFINAYFAQPETLHLERSLPHGTGPFFFRHTRMYLSPGTELYSPTLKAESDHNAGVPCFVLHAKTQYGTASNRDKRENEALYR